MYTCPGRPELKIIDLRSPSVATVARDGKWSLKLRHKGQSVFGSYVARPCYLLGLFAGEYNLGRIFGRVGDLSWMGHWVGVAAAMLCPRRSKAPRDSAFSLDPALFVDCCLLHAPLMVPSWFREPAAAQWTASAKLRSLSIAWRSAVDAWRASTRECCIGSIVGVRGSRVTVEAARHICSSCPALERLDLTGATLLNDDALVALAGSCPRLRHLSLQRSGALGTSFSDVGLRAISRLVRLAALDLGGLGAHL